MNVGVVWLVVFFLVIVIIVIRKTRPDAHTGKQLFERR